MVAAPGRGPTSSRSLRFAMLASLTLGRGPAAGLVLDGLDPAVAAHVGPALHELAAAAQVVGDVEHRLHRGSERVRPACRLAVRPSVLLG